MPTLVVGMFKTSEKRAWPSNLGHGTRAPALGHGTRAYHLSPAQYFFHCLIDILGIYGFIAAEGGLAAGAKLAGEVTKARRPRVVV